MTPNRTELHPIFGGSRTPRYLQLADVFRQRITRGQWQPGDMLPSIDKLMEEFCVARVTVRQAIKGLAEEGLVSPQRGVGTVVNEFASAKRQLRVHTTFAGLVDMYQGDKPVLTNLEATNAFPELSDSEGIAAPSYVHMRRVHARDSIKYCVISLYLDERVFSKAPARFRNEAVLPVLLSLTDVQLGRARQIMHIAKADIDTARLLDIAVGEPMAEVRRILLGLDGTVVYVADVIYRGDHIHLDMDLSP